MTFVFDLDGTLCENRISFEQSYYDVKPLHNAWSIVKKLKKDGHYLVLYTARGMGTYRNDQKKVVAVHKPLLEQWLQEYGLEDIFDEICFGKANAQIFVDDKSISSINQLIECDFDNKKHHKLMIDTADCAVVEEYLKTDIGDYFCGITTNLKSMHEIGAKNINDVVKQVQVLNSLVDIPIHVQLPNSNIGTLQACKFVDSICRQAQCRIVIKTAHNMEIVEELYKNFPDVPINITGICNKNTALSFAVLPNVKYLSFIPGRASVDIWNDIEYTARIIDSLSTEIIIGSTRTKDDIIRSLDNHLIPTIGKKLIGAINKDDIENIDDRKCDQCEISNNDEEKFFVEMNEYGKEIYKSLKNIDDDNDLYIDAQEAVSRTKNGEVIIISDEKRENEGDLFIPAQFITEEKLKLFVLKACGLLCIPMTEEKREQLGIPKLETNHKDKFSTPFATAVDSTKCTTGMSITDRLKTIDAILNNGELSYPGHLFPLIAKKNLVLERCGHTESAITLCRLANVQEVGIICEIMNSDGSMACGETLEDFAQKHKLKIVTIESIIELYKGLQ